MKWLVLVTSANEMINVSDLSQWNDWLLVISPNEMIDLVTSTKEMIDLVLSAI